MNLMQTLSKRLLVGLGIMSLIIFGASLALAQDDGDNWRNDTSNWCDIDKKWGPEYCDTDDEAITNWRYRAGWWFQRVTERDILPCDLPEDLQPRYCTVDLGANDGNDVNIPSCDFPNGDFPNGDFPNGDFPNGDFPNCDFPG